MNDTKKQESNFFKDWIIPIIAAIIIYFIINKFLLFNIFVPTGSMIPTIQINDKICVTRIYNTDNIKRGQILVFNSDEYDDKLIKRVIGLPGDHVDVKDGKVYINNVELKEDYVKNTDLYNGSFDVPEGKYLFFGDNRPHSADARVWKNPYIDKSQIEGRARFIFLPFKDMKFL